MVSYIFLQFEKFGAGGNPKAGLWALQAGRQLAASKEIDPFLFHSPLAWFLSL